MTLGSDFPPISTNFEKHSKVSNQSSFPPPVKRNANDFEDKGASAWNKPKGPTVEHKTFAQVLRPQPKATKGWSLGNVNKSLVDGAEGKREFVARKSFSMMDGKPTLIFNEEECEKLDARLGRSLICKFPNIIPNYTYVKQGFERLKLVGGYTYGPLGPKHLLLNLELEEDYSRLWHNGTLKFFGIPNGTIFKWTPEFEIDKEPPVAPIWIALPKLPLRLCHRECFMEIGNFFGKPLRIDDGAALLSRPSLPRILVEVNVLEPKLEHIQLATTCKGQITKIRQPVVYEDWPAYCSKCCVFGHGADSCAVEKNETVIDDQTYAELASYHNQRMVKKGTFKARFAQPAQQRTKKETDGTNSFNVLNSDPMAQDTTTVTVDKDADLSVKGTDGTNSFNVLGSVKESPVVIEKRDDNLPITVAQKATNAVEDDELPITVAQQAVQAVNASTNSQQKRIIPTLVEATKKTEEVTGLVDEKGIEADEKSGEEEETDEEQSEDEETKAQNKKEELKRRTEKIIHWLRSKEMTLQSLNEREDYLATQIEMNPNTCWEQVRTEFHIVKDRLTKERKERKAARRKQRMEEKADDE